MSSERARRGLMLVLSSPSGVGKTSLSRRLVADHHDLDLSISMTTRAPRPGEHEGREYFFVSEEEFDRQIEAGAFFEWAELHGHQRSGTPKGPVMESLAAGRDVMFDIDYQGARAIAEAAPEDTVRIFILPPSMAEMVRRIRVRAGDSEEMIRRRLETAREEFTKWGEYDYAVVNDDFDHAYAELAHIYHAERLKRSRNPWVALFVQDLIEQSLGSI
ncbi:MAG TPA: guanylate kinase [Caulobacteraceae bacterium]|jgi:guanylate kinase|nr:guanylate kinase [Caulobacteraceae bacterium]